MASKNTVSKKAKGKENKQYQKALASFEVAIKTLHGGNPEKAKGQFLQLQEAFSEDQDLMGNVRSYLSVCEKKLAPSRKAKTSEELTTAAIISLNSGDPEQAIKQLSKAEDLDPENSHVQYCLAAAYAVSGDAAETENHLQKAIAKDPSSLIAAKLDDDFDSVRDSEGIAALLVEA